MSRKRVGGESLRSLAAVLMLCLAVPSPAVAQEVVPLGIGQWLTASSNSDGGYRSTQFFQPNYDTVVFGIDGKVELWLPPFRNSLAWGPYLRLAAIRSSRDEPWENAWLGAPGVGLQVFPFSHATTRETRAGRWLGPLRVFAEHNVVNYWGDVNSWRPRRQTRIGLDYWRALHVNDHDRGWWLETWQGIFRQSANEFTPDYDTTVVANTARFGVRMPGAGLSSAVTPYAAVESSWTKNDAYYWENRLVAGGGVRLTPNLANRKNSTTRWLARLVVYGEYLRAATYYRMTPDSTVPRFDARLGVSVTVGDWYK